MPEIVDKNPHGKTMKTFPKHVNLENIKITYFRKRPK